MTEAAPKQTISKEAPSKGSAKASTLHRHTSPESLGAAPRRRQLRRMNPRWMQPRTMQLRSMRHPRRRAPGRPLDGCSLDNFEGGTLVREPRSVHFAYVCFPGEPWCGPWKDATAKEEPWCGPWKDATAKEATSRKPRRMQPRRRQLRSRHPRRGAEGRPLKGCSLGSPGAAALHPYTSPGSPGGAPRRRQPRRRPL